MPNVILNSKEIAGRFNQIRKEQNLTQQQLAAKLGISQPAVSKYLKNRIPTPEVLLGMAHIGNTTMEWILTGEKSYFYEESGLEVREGATEGYDTERSLAKTIATLPVEIRHAIVTLIQYLTPSGKE